MKHYLTSILLACVATTAFAAEPLVWRARVGLSTVSGAVALEADLGKIAPAVGWLPRAGQPNARTGQRWVFSGRVFLQPKSPDPFFHSPFVGTSFIINNNAYLYEAIVDPAPDADLENFESYILELRRFHTIGGFAGYRYVFNEQLDATLAGGVGLTLGHDSDAEGEIKKAQPLIDLTVGLAF